MVENRINIRLPKNEKAYYTFKLKEFADLFNGEIIAVEYGKQDIRGTESITLIDLKRCVPVQKFFNNKWELLGFVCGFVIGHTDRYGEFSRYFKVGGIND